MAYGSNQMTNTTGAVFIDERWSKEAEIAREDNLVMANLVMRKDSDAAGHGDRVNVPFASNLTATPVNDNTAVTFQAPTENELTMLLNRHYESSFAIQDKLSIQSAYDLAKIYSEKIGFAIAKQIDSDLTGLYSGLSQYVGDGNTAITEANIVRAIQYLDDANAPQNDRHFVVKPAGMNDLRQITRFTDYQQANNGKAPQVGGNGGMVGNVFNVTVHMSTNVQTAVGTPSVIHNLLFQKDAFALAVQKSVSVEKDRRPDYLATGYVASALWGYMELRDDHAVDFRSAL